MHYCLKIYRVSNQNVLMIGAAKLYGRTVVLATRHHVLTEKGKQTKHPHGYATPPLKGHPKGSIINK